VGAQHGLGYIDVAVATGGGAGSICRVDFSEPITRFLDKIIAENAPIRLSKPVIVSSIQVAIDGVRIGRQGTPRWRYDRNSRAIVIEGLSTLNRPPDAAPFVVAIGYRYWQLSQP